MSALLRVCALAMLLVPLAIAALLGAAVLSEAGSRQLIGALHRVVPGLEIEYAGGSLARELRLRRVQLAQGDMTLLITDLSIAADHRCLWYSELCFTRLSADALTLDLAADADTDHTSGSGSDADADDVDSDDEPVRFPVPMSTDALQLNALTVRWPGGMWRQGEARLALRLHDSTIDVRSAVARRPRLQIDVDDDADNTRTELSAIDLPLLLKVAALELHEPVIAIAGSEVAGAHLRLSGQWQGTQLALANVETALPAYGEFTLAGSLDFSGDWLVQAQLGWHTNATLNATLDGTDWLADRRVQAELSGTLASLAITLDAPGAPSLALQAELDTLAPDLPFSANATADALAPVLDAIELPEALAELALTAPLRASARGTLAAQDLTLTTALQLPPYDAPLALDASVRHTALDDGHRLDIHRLDLRDSAGDNAGNNAGDDTGDDTGSDTSNGTGGNALRAQGELNWRGKLSGDGLGDSVPGGREKSDDDGLQATLSLQSTGFDLPALGETVSGRLRGSLNARGEYRAGQWSLALSDVALAGEINGYPARANGFAALSGGGSSPLQLGPSALDADLNGARLRLTQAEDGSAAGRLQLSVDDLGRWHGDAGGALDIDATLSPEQLRARGTLRAVRWQDTRIAGGTLSGEYRPETGQFQADVALAGIDAAGAQWSQLTLAADGDRAQQQLTLAADGAVQGELRLAGGGDRSQWRGQLAPTRLHTALGDWVLDSAVPLQWTAAGAQLQLGAHCWRQAASSLCPGRWLLGASGGGTLAARGDLGVLAPLLPPGTTLSGPLTLDLDTRWAPEQPLAANATLQLSAPTVTYETVTYETVAYERVTYDTAAHEADTGGARRFGWDAGSARIALQGGSLALSAALRRADHDELAAELQLPAARTGALAGELRVRQLSLTGLAAFAPQLSQLEGTVDGTLQLAGTPAQPRASGRLALTGGAVVLRDNPTTLQDVTLSVLLQDDTARIDGQGLLGGGELQLTGTARLSSTTQLPGTTQLDVTTQLAGTAPLADTAQPDATTPADGTPWLTLSLRGRDNRLLYPPATTELVVSPQLAFAAGPDRLALTGAIAVTGGTIVFSQLPEDSVALSPDVVRVDLDAPATQAVASLPVQINVRVPVADRLRLTGALVDTTLGGELRVAQEPGQPLQVFGSLRANGGELHAYQHRLSLRRAVLSFTGAPDNPALDLRAERRIQRDNVTAGIQLQGPVQQELVLDVYAEPAMSQGDAMSYLVRGRPLDAGAGVDGTATALSLAGGVLNRSELVHALNRVPGVSELSFGAEGSEDETSATVGGYLGERLYLSYGLGLYEPINTLTARLYLQSRLWLEVVSRLENTVDLYYSFDLD